MPYAYKVVAALVAAALMLSVVVGLILSHHIGGFLRTVEREAREEEARRDAADAARETEPGASGD